MELFASDAELLNSRYRPKIAANGLALIRSYIQETVIEQNGHITLQDLSDDGDSIQARIELQSDRIKQAGLNRIMGTEKFWINDGRIRGFLFEMNLVDDETKRFFDFIRVLELNRPAN
jgi:hypothetical protein